MLRSLSTVLGLPRRLITFNQPFRRRLFFCGASTVAARPIAMMPPPSIAEFLSRARDQLTAPSSSQKTLTFVIGNESAGKYISRQCICLC